MPRPGPVSHSVPCIYNLSLHVLIKKKRGHFIQWGREMEITTRSHPAPIVPIWPSIWDPTGYTPVASPSHPCGFRSHHTNQGNAVIIWKDASWGWPMGRVAGMSRARAVWPRIDRKTVLAFKETTTKGRIDGSSCSLLWDVSLCVV